MISLDIFVADISTVITMFDYIKIYRSDAEDGTFSEITTPSSRIHLVSSLSDYTYVDPNGTTDNWYRSSYYSSATSAESVLSDPIQGGTSLEYHRVIYPPEVCLGEIEEAIVKRIRRYIGDYRKVKYMYYTDCTELVTSNPHILDMKTKMWPLYVCLDDIEKTSTSDPYVDGYRYLTFSGIVDTTSRLEIFYADFRYSDLEIYEAYTTTAIPPGLTSATVTKEHLILQASIDLLEAENIDDFINEGAKIKEGDDSFDPDAGFKARNRLMDRLRRKLKALIDQYMFIGTDGVRID